MSTDQVLAYLAEHQQRHLDQLCDWLRIPSISSEKSPHGHAARRRVRRRRATRPRPRRRGSIPGGHPLIYAESEQRPDRKTLLFYGHYDVQPVDPARAVDSPAVRAGDRDGVIYARGASDDKGQLYCHVKALEAYLEQGLELPVNVKFIIEGEEECGGHSIYEYTEQNPEKLACDAVVISDTTLYNADHAGRLLLAEGPLLHGDPSDRPRHGPALRQLRRHGAEPGQRHRRDHRRSCATRTDGAWCPASTIRCSTSTRRSARPSPRWTTPTRC